jgi:hypothetical protein
MIEKRIHTFLTYFVALVWFTNGLFCKVLNLVPRHQEIVSRILGTSNSKTLTIIIGISEIFMAIWILSKIKIRLNVITQITVVATMNILEFILVPDLLLWGKFNAIFAFIFILVVCCNEFYFRKKLIQST